MLKTILLGAGMLLFMLFLSRRRSSITEQPATPPGATEASWLPAKRQNVSLSHFERSPAQARPGSLALDGK